MFETEFNGICYSLLLAARSWTKIFGARIVHVADDLCDVCIFAAGFQCYKIRPIF